MQTAEGKRVQSDQTNRTIDRGKQDQVFTLSRLDFHKRNNQRNQQALSKVNL